MTARPMVVIYTHIGNPGVYPGCPLTTTVIRSYCRGSYLDAFGTCEGKHGEYIFYDDHSISHTKQRGLLVVVGCGVMLSMPGSNSRCCRDPRVVVNYSMLFLNAGGIKRRVT